MQEEKLIDIKGTLEKFIKPDEPEMSQEEAIAKFSDINEEIRRIANSTGGGDGEAGENTEEQEHLARIKQELLASLKRVEELEKKIYGPEKEEQAKPAKSSKGKQMEQYKTKQVGRSNTKDVKEMEQQEGQKERE